MIGARVYPDAEGRLRLAEGDYGLGRDGVWYARPPGEVGTGSLANHNVTEHDDGTITVSPSIRVRTYCGDREIVWHGFLECGVWKEAA